MLRFISILILLLSLSVNCAAFELVGSGVVASGGCSSGTTDSSVSTNSSGSGANYPRGNSFTVSQNGTLYSISAYIATATATTVELRVGTDPDLETAGNILESVQLSSPSVGWIEFVFTTNPEVSTGTTYYWAVKASESGGYTRYESVGSDGRGNYGSSSASFDMGYTEDTKNYMEDIKLCD